MIYVRLLVSIAARLSNKNFPGKKTHYYLHNYHLDIHLCSNPVQVTTEEGETIEYTVDSGKMKALIEGSVFCSQRVEFQCKVRYAKPWGSNHNGVVNLSAN